MKRFSIFLIAMLPFLLNAQENSTAKSPFLKPYNIHLMTGLSFYTTPPLTRAEMLQIAPNSQMLTQSHPNFHSSNGFGFSVNSTPSFSAIAEFIPYDKKKNDYKWYSAIRAGFIYRSVYVSGPGFFRQTTTHLDTTVSGNQTYYTDSVSNENYSFDWSGQSIGLDLSQIFHTNDQRLFSFWAGYGLQLSVCVNNYFHGFYSTFSQKQTYTVNGPDISTTSSQPTFDMDNETIHTKSAFVTRLYFPVGIQWRLSRKQNFLNKLAFTLEMRASMDLQTVPGLDRVLTRFYYNQNFGLKYYFHYGAAK